MHSPPCRASEMRPVVDSYSASRVAGSVPRAEYLVWGERVGSVRKWGGGDARRSRENNNAQDEPEAGRGQGGEDEGDFDPAGRGDFPSRVGGER